MKIEDNIETFNSLLKRRGFIWGPSPEIYGGLAGFYSYGPAGMAIKSNMISLFRRELVVLNPYTKRNIGKTRNPHQIIELDQNSRFGHDLASS